MKIKFTFGLLAFIIGAVLVFTSFGTAQAQSEKVYVCKFVGTPGVDERLQTGQNPIEVSVNAIPDWPVDIGSYFADAHGRSYVLGFVPMDPEPTTADCPQPPPVPGCTDPAAVNYNPAATVDDGSCEYPPDPIPGCTDPAAVNYNPAATVDDGTCEYPGPDPTPPPPPQITAGNNKGGFSFLPFGLGVALIALGMFLIGKK